MSVSPTAAKNNLQVLKRKSGLTDEHIDKLVAMGIEKQEDLRLSTPRDFMTFTGCDEATAQKASDFVNRMEINMRTWLVDEIGLSGQQIEALEKANIRTFETLKGQTANQLMDITMCNRTMANAIVEGISI